MLLVEVLIHDLTIGGRLLSIGIGAIVYRLIILNIYEIPNLDQNLVRLFNAILFFGFICTRIAKEIKDSWFEIEK